MNVAVVSEVRLYRESIAELLRSSSQLRVVGTPSMEDAVRLRELPAAVVIVCGDMRSAVQLAAHLSEARLVAVSGADADELVDGVEAGIAGFLSPESSVDDLIDTIERVVVGEFVCPLELAGVLATR